MEFSEQVVVLQLGKFKEADLWVRFLSPSRGILSAFAFGGSRSKRRFVGCLDTFNLVLFRLQYSAKTSFFSLIEGVLLKGPTRLRHDWARLGIANNCSSYMQSFGITAEGATTAHALFIELLQVLEEADTLPQLLPFYFRMRLAVDQGYEISIEQCSACATLFGNEKVFFDVHSGQMLCGVCLAHTTSRPIVLYPEALQAFACIATEPLSAWGSVQLNARDRYACAQAIDSFIHYHVGLTWEKGRFSRS